MKDRTRDSLLNRPARAQAAARFSKARQRREKVSRCEWLEPRYLLAASSASITALLGPAAAATSSAGAAATFSAGAAATFSAGAAATLPAGVERPNYQLFSAAGLSPQASASPVGHTPSQISQAYGFNQITFNGGVVGDGSGQTIAIIDAYDAPTIENDLHVFDTTFSLPDPPNFTRVAEDGSTNFPPTDPAGSPGAGDNTWEIETALDVEWAHALAPAANILLVEADSSSDFDLIQTGVNYARNQPGVVAVSMSFSGSEFSGETSLDTYFTTPSGHGGVTFLSATGDDGQPSGYPPFSPNVVAVGGTTLSIDSAGDYLSESGWSGSGGSVSKNESQPAYQAGIVTQSTTKRANPDVAFDADPNSGVAIYDSYDFGAAGWIQVGGTSFATPAWAAIVAVTDQGRSLSGLGSLDGGSQTLPMLYQLPSADFHDITTGNNGFAAGPGYDLVTGLGSPHADLVVGALVGSSVSGTVFNDANSDGVQDNGETGQAGWTVFDDLNDNGVLDTSVESKLDSTNVPVTIPDRRTITSTVTVGGLSGSISDLNVDLNITHTFDSDLVITLISPSGVSVTLASHDGSSGHNYTDTVFDDQAATPIASGTAPFTGSFRPVSALSAFDGADPNGVWTLQVADTVRLDSGTLNHWSLDITTGAEPSTTTDADGNYRFVDLATGEHHLRELLQPDFTETAPAGEVYDVAVAPGTTLVNENFGNGPVQPANTGPVKGDFDGDGKLDPSDVMAMMLALADYPAYAATYANPVPQDQLVPMGDFDGDNALTNADLQGLISAIANAATQTAGSGNVGSGSAGTGSSSANTTSLAGVATLPAVQTAVDARPTINAIASSAGPLSAVSANDMPATNEKLPNIFAIGSELPAVSESFALSAQIVHARPILLGGDNSNALAQLPPGIDQNTASESATELLRRHLRWSHHLPSAGMTDEVFSQWA